MGLQESQRSTYPKFNIHSIINFGAARIAASSLAILSYSGVQHRLSTNPLSNIKKCTLLGHKSLRRTETAQKIYNLSPFGAIAARKVGLLDNFP